MSTGSFGRSGAADRHPAFGWAVWTAAALVVMIVYGLIACTAASELGSRTAREDYYNRLSDGFARGHLFLDLEVPPGFAALPNPYDAAANAPFHGQMYAPGRIHDLSYYRGRFYLYFSGIPAVALFLPFHALTGAYLSHQQACALFCGGGFLAAAFLVESIRRRYFSGAGALAQIVAVLGVGLIPVAPLVLQRPDVWEVPITASYLFWMLSLLALWRHFCRSLAAWAPVLAASAAAALAIGCRPASGLGAAILLLPFARGLRPGGSVGARKIGALAAAVALPMATIGLALCVYNYARFGSIFEFGQKYQLTQQPEGQYGHFRLEFLWANFRLYFLEYPGWQHAFPFVRDLAAPEMPAGHLMVDSPVGALTVLPFTLCAAAVPWAVRQGSGISRRPLALIAAAMLLLFGGVSLPLCLYFATCLRYQLEFVPALTLLGAIGFLALAADFRPAPTLRRLVVGAALAGAGVSIAFNLLSALSHRSDADTQHGLIVMQAGQLESAAVWYQRAVRLRPANTMALLGLSDIELKKGKFAEAAAEFKAVEQIDPSSPTMHLNYAYCLFRLGDRTGAQAECAIALRLRPNFPAALEAQRELSAAP